MPESMREYEKNLDFPKGKMKDDTFLRGKIRKMGNIWIKFATSPKVNC